MNLKFKWNYWIALHNRRFKDTNALVLFLFLRKDVSDLGHILTPCQTVTSTWSKKTELDLNYSKPKTRTYGDFVFSQL